MALKKTNHGTTRDFVQERWLADRREEINAEIERQREMWPKAEFDTTIRNLTLMDHCSKPEEWDKWRCEFSRKNFDLIHEVPFIIIASGLVQAIEACYLPKPSIWEQMPSRDSSLALLKHVLTQTHEEVVRLCGSYVDSHRQTAPSLAFEHPYLMQSVQREICMHLGWNLSKVPVAGLKSMVMGNGFKVANNLYVQRMTWSPGEGASVAARRILMGEGPDRSFVLTFEEDEYLSGKPETTLKLHYTRQPMGQPIPRIRPIKVNAELTSKTFSHSWEQML